MLKDNLLWKVGKCSEVNFWTDPWLPNCERLQDNALGKISLVDSATPLKNFVLTKGDWDLNKLQTLLPTLETVLHVFRDCDQVKPVWLYFKKSATGSFLCVNNSSIWLVENLVKNGADVILETWTVLFAAVLDRIWSNRNEFVFSNGNHSIKRIIHQSEDMARDF
ncbi:hypothetical protein MTR_8g027895 [Medicago truncatula]|uniref:Uncharacterized protein n=1 Tax=Medicago truncatula TaxID=3880 RepID=A0A072TPA8_MEDTR|nr:hypothetical protein MTR_8g027895 [Medicago truncatula]